MTTMVHLPRPLIALGVPVVGIAGMAFLVSSPLFQTAPKALALGVTLDLLLTIPIVYFLIVRKSSIPNTTVVPVLLLCVAAGSYILPESHQGLLNHFKTWGGPFVELTVLTIIVLKVRSIVRRYNGKKSRSVDFYTALLETCKELFPRSLTHVLATEIAVFYYGFFHWKPVRLSEHEFTYHKRSGTPALLAAAIGIIAVETVVLHILLVQWSLIAAWILTGLSIYTALQITGFARSLAKRPIVLEQDRLVLRYGIMSETEIPYEEIESIELSGQSLPEGSRATKLSPLGDLEKHNVIIRLKEENLLTGLYGSKKTYRTLALHVDDAEAFTQRVNSGMREFRDEGGGIRDAEGRSASDLALKK